MLHNFFNEKKVEIGIEHPNLYLSKLYMKLSLLISIRFLLVFYVQIFSPTIFAYSSKQEAEGICFYLKPCLLETVSCLKYMSSD